MSCSLWRWTEICDHRPCPGDCDECGYPDEEEGVPDGWNTASDVHAADGSSVRTIR